VVLHFKVDFKPHIEDSERLCAWYSNGRLLALGSWRSADICFSF
jgi:hypothetical protein